MIPATQWGMSMSKPNPVCVHEKVQTHDMIQSRSFQSESSMIFELGVNCL